MNVWSTECIYNMIYVEGTDRDMTSDFPSDLTQRTSVQCMFSWTSEDLGPGATSLLWCPHQQLFMNNHIRLYTIKSLCIALYSYVMLRHMIVHYISWYMTLNYSISYHISFHMDNSTMWLCVYSRCLWVSIISRLSISPLPINLPVQTRHLSTWSPRWTMQGRFLKTLKNKTNKQALLVCCVCMCLPVSLGA